MLLELLTSWRTLCPSPLARLGYRYAAVACAARARRCAAAWAAHQARTRSAILAAAAEANPAGTAVILGSGPCLDIPVRDLASNFARVVLVDAAHPPPARALAAALPNVSLASVDLTGMAAALADPRASGPPPPGCRAFLADRSVTLVVSANLMSQLPLLPLAATARRWPEADLAGLGQAIAIAHQNHLHSFRCPVLLVTDHEHRVFDRTGRLLERTDPLFGVTLPDGEDWDWTIAPPGEMANGNSLVAQVRALRLQGAAQPTA